MTDALESRDGGYCCSPAPGCVTLVGDISLRSYAIDIFIEKLRSLD